MTDIQELNPQSLSTPAPELSFTGERVVPGNTPEEIFRESQMRYAFAGQFVQGRCVVDVASGTGIGTHYLLRCGAVSCLGLDANIATAQYAEFTFGDERCRFATADAMRLCIPDSSVDVVVSFETIEHVSDPSALLQECDRVLRPNGILVCSTPDRDFFRWAPENPFHLSEMTRGEFMRKVSAIFPSCTLYSQGSVNYPRYVAEMMARKNILPWLEKMRVKMFLRNLARRPPMKISTEREFKVGNGHYERYRVMPYRRRRLTRAPYLVIVARKSA